MKDEKGAVRVAIVGSGLAGLTIAHILHADKHKRYSITILEQSPRLSFDSLSVSVKTPSGAERIDLPMRAAAGGYYHNLMRMYAHLKIPMHPVRFLFVFAKALPLPSLSLPATVPGCYFVHASNLHQMPPPWPQSRGLVLHLVEVIFLIVCHFWFTLACFLVPPASSPSGDLGDSDDDDNGGQDEYQGKDKADETLREYLDRIWLPKRYISHYLLPLMSSVSTCSHSEMLDFPASDITAYKRLSHGQQHYVVCGGIHQVQSRLVSGLSDIRLAVRVQSVRPLATGVCVRYNHPDQPPSEHAEEEEVFDRVILAVSPDVAARLFAPVRPLLACVPTRQVESSVLDANARVVDDAHESAVCSHHGVEGNKAQVITFRTAFSVDGSHTEALHAMPSGVIVQTCPLGDADAHGKGTLQTARFTRTLRSRQSRRLVNKMMREDRGGGDMWMNGRDDVWLAGAWCWDGMVLLEGCVVSAMRIARDFGVEVPWD